MVKRERERREEREKGASEQELQLST